MTRMRTRSFRPEIPIRTPLSNPFQKWFEQRRLAQAFNAVIRPRQVRVPKRRVHLLMTRLAQRRAVLGLTALLPGLEMMLRDQPRRDSALAEFTRAPLIVVVTRRRMIVV
jgi:hypothetical protein